MHSPDTMELDRILKNLVHDLRQPLGNIETSAYYLGLLLRNEDAHACEQIRTIEQQVDRAAAMLTAAVAELNRVRSTPAAKATVFSVTA